MVVAGLTGAATFGAAALLCEYEALFGLPPTSTYVRAFRVEVRLTMHGRLRHVIDARVAELWTRESGKFEKAPSSRWALLRHG